MGEGLGFGGGVKSSSMLHVGVAKIRPCVQRLLELQSKVETK